MGNHQGIRYRPMRHVPTMSTSVSIRATPLLRGGDIRSGRGGRQGDMADKMSPVGVFSLHLLRELASCAAASAAGSTSTGQPTLLFWAIVGIISQPRRLRFKVTG